MKKHSNTLQVLILRSVVLTLSIVWPFYTAHSQSFPAPVLSEGPHYVEQSIMQSGHWVKVRIPESGVYKITDDELHKAGFSHPERVGVYGYGGAMLPEDLRRITSTDVPALPSLREGNAIYFYASGTTTWYYNASSNRFEHTTNVYATEGYCLLSDAIEPLRVEMKKGYTTAEIEERSTTAVLLHEEDKISLAYSGRKLWGEPFLFRSDYRIEETLPPHANGTVEAKLRYASRRSTEGTMTLSINGNKLIEDRLPRINPDSEQFGSYIRGYDCIAYSNTSVQPTSDKLWIELRYSQNAQKVYLDYYELNIAAQLRLTKGWQLAMYQKPRDETKGKVVKYIIEGADAETRVFATSEIGSVALCPTEAQTDGYAFTDKAPDQRGASYLAFRLSDAKKAEIIGSIPNQDLRAQQWPDLLIITPEGLKPEAERLAEYHRSADKMRVVIATDEQVYNEFTGGTPDATAYRLLAKTYYDQYLRKESELRGPCPMQLLLFGDGSYDNRMITSEWKLYKGKGYNFLLTYQSENSLDVESYTADDYFTALNASTSDRALGAQKSLIGVGRIAVRTPQEAHTVVSKTIRYAEDRNIGDWKNKAIFVADNQDGFTHLTQSDGVTKVLENVNPAMMVDRVLLDMYKLVSINGKTTSPDAIRKLHEALNKGALLINYNGHGGPQGWTDEQLLTLPMIKNFRYNRLPIWITSTCDFANFDHFSTSAGEEVLLNEQSGAPALITTTRVVLDQPNYNLNRSLIKKLFERTPNKRGYRLGSVLSEAKTPTEGGYISKSDTVNKLSFFVLGDPALSLRLPTHKIRVKTINGAETNGRIPLKALQPVVMEGDVIDLDTDEIDEQFNGQLYVSVFDSKQELTTFPDNKGRTSSIHDYPSIIYAGLANVSAGRFQCRFIVPKDLIYTGTEGRANFYSYDSERGLEATGYDKSFYIEHGLGQEEMDSTPPTVERCFLGSEAFKNGGKVNETPLFVAQLFDQSGINYSGLGTGHDITLSIEGATTAIYNLNAYFTPSSLEAGKGQVAFTLPSLNPGDHKATFTVWDIFNNVSTYQFDFRVVTGIAPLGVTATVHPNPVRTDNITVSVQSNQPAVEMSCYIELYDFTGRRVMQSPKTSISSSLTAPATLSVHLDDSLSDGLYLYKVYVGHRSEEMSSATGKLVLQRQ